MRTYFLLAVFICLGLFFVPHQGQAAEVSAPPEEAADKEYDAADKGPLDQEALRVADPLAPWNRVMFTFNDRLYFWALKPLAQGYTYVVPLPARKGVRNFFYNLETPKRFVSCLLQAKGGAAARELAGFAMNSTVGFFGLFNPAEQTFGPAPPEEDLGQVFGAWGLGHGFYIVWPFLGPSSLRDSFGKAGDRYLDPFNYVDPEETAYWAFGLETVNSTSFRIGDYESLLDFALEPYDAVQDAYLQHRKKQVNE